MYFELIDHILRMVLALFFGFSALVGLVGAIHSVALDGETRKLSRQSQEILNGLHDTLVERKASIDEKRKARQEKLENLA